MYKKVAEVTADMRKDWFYHNGWYADDDIIEGWYSNKIKEDDMDYKLIRNTQASYLEREVTSHLQKGYILAGGVFIAGGMIYQAVLKEGK